LKFLQLAVTAVLQAFKLSPFSGSFHLFRSLSGGMASPWIWPELPDEILERVIAQASLNVTLMSYGVSKKWNTMVSTLRSRSQESGIKTTGRVAFVDTVTALLNVPCLRHTVALDYRSGAAAKRVLNDIHEHEHKIKKCLSEGGLELKYLDLSGLDFDEEWCDNDYTKSGHMLGFDMLLRASGGNKLEALGLNSAINLNLQAIWCIVEHPALGFLERIDLSMINIHDRHVESLFSVARRLRALGLRQTQITDDIWCQDIFIPETIESLDVSQTGIRDASLIAIARKLTGLMHFSIYACRGITHEGLSNLGDRMPKLETLIASSLHINHWHFTTPRFEPAFDGNNGFQIERFGSLTSLDLSIPTIAARLKEEQLTMLLEQTRRLVVLRLIGLTSASLPTAVAISQLASLKELYLTGTSMTFPCIGTIANGPEAVAGQLQILHLAASPIFTNGLGAIISHAWAYGHTFQDYRSVQDLDISHTDIDDDGLAAAVDVLKSLTRLQIGWCKRLTSEGIIKLFCSSPQLPAGWRQVKDPKTGRPYYFTPDGSTTWTAPPHVLTPISQGSHARGNLDQLSVVNLSGLSPTSRLLRCLSQLQRLQHLHLSGPTHETLTPSKRSKVKGYSYAVASHLPLIGPIIPSGINTEELDSCHGVPSTSKSKSPLPGVQHDIEYLHVESWPALRVAVFDRSDGGEACLEALAATWNAKAMLKKLVTLSLVDTSFSQNSLSSAVDRAPRLTKVKLGGRGVVDMTFITEIRPEIKMHYVDRDGQPIFPKFAPNTDNWLY